MGTNRYLKTTIIIRALLIALVGFYVSLFFLHQWLISPIWLAVVFCILPYAIIYFHKERKYGVGLIALISLGLLYYLDGGIYLILSMLCTVIGFYKTSDVIHEDIHNKIKISGLDIFTGESVSTFMSYLTLTYVFTFMSFYQTFNLNCNDLFAYSNKLTEKIFLVGSPDVVNQAQGYVTSFFGNVAGGKLDQNNTNGISSGIIATEKNDPGIKYRVTTLLNEGNNDVSHGVSKGSLVTNAIQLHNATSNKGESDLNINILKIIDNYRHQVVNQTLNNDIQNGMCSVVIKNISDQYNKQGFKISVIYLMYTLLSSAMQFVFQVIAYVNRILFSIMFKIGWFKKYEDWQVSENLE